MLNQRMAVSDAANLTGSETLVYLNQINLKSYVVSAVSKTPTQLSLTANGKALVYPLTGDGTCTIPIRVVNP